MRVLQSTAGFDLKDHTPVLITLPLPFTLPENCASGLPVRADLRPEHVLLDGLWIDEGVPNLLDGSAYHHDCVRDETSFHLGNPSAPHPITGALAACCIASPITFIASESGSTGVNVGSAPEARVAIAMSSTIFTGSRSTTRKIERA